MGQRHVPLALALEPPALPFRQLVQTNPADGFIQHDWLPLPFVRFRLLRQAAEREAQRSGRREMHGSVWPKLINASRGGEAKGPSFDLQAIS